MENRANEEMGEIREENGSNKEVGEIRQENNGFVIHTVEGPIAEITYVPLDDSTWIIDHTYVTPEYRGGNLAQRLLRRVAEEARTQGKLIIPACSYAAVQFKRNPEYADVWKHTD